MKVIHLISGGDTGGAKTHIFSLLRNLSETIDVTMVCFVEGDFSQEARALGIDTKVLSGGNLLKTFSALKKMIVSEKYDLIHCHGARGNMMGAMLKQATGTPIVTTVHSDYRLDYLGRPLSRLTYGTINTLALRRFNYHIGVSDAMVDLLISRKFNPQNLFAIYNGLDFSLPAPELTRQEYFDSVDLQSDADSVVVGIAARLHPVKDVATLIRGFAAAYATCPNLRLLIAGDGEERAMLTQLVDSLGITSVVAFAGWVSDTNSFYQAIDINTLTSLSETFPYVLTEGARASLPTISSRVGGVPYLIDHNVHGLLFTPGDVEHLSQHLISLALDPQLREQLGSRLHQKAVDTYSLTSTIQRQLDIYETILRRKHAPTSKRNGVVVCGAYGRGNAGDDAILEAIVMELRDIDEDLPIWVLSRRPMETRTRYRVNSVYTFNIPGFLRKMSKSKLYINGGGSLMQDVTSHRSLWFYLFTLISAKLLGSQVLMYGCGIGPINNPRNRRRCTKVLDRYVDAITLRDTHSLNELKDMGVTKPALTLTADPTVIIPPSPEQAIDAMLESEGLDPNGRYLGITVRPWPNYDKQAHLFGQLADYAYHTYGLTPVFLPIEGRLDIPACKKASANMSAPFHVIQSTGNSSQTIGLFSRMKVVISMRLHALVFSAGQGVPLVGVVYDPKVSSFLSYIGQDLFTELDDATFDGLKAHLDIAVSRIDDEDFLTSAIQRLREVEQGNTDVAKTFLK